uniref:Ethylene-responsive transcription factor ERF016 n=1 Tax=Elaeis guineensis var. tenera TaxID=51953 RepID=A0A6I9SBA7_ELAGV|nr:ethylene-responsive transcription factor ERF016 [Elaeis guineensis]
MRKWGKWVAEVRLPNSRERIWLGSYDTAEKAARAFDAASYCLCGTQAVVNFPADPPNIPSPGRLTRNEIRAVASKHAHEAPRAGPDEDAGPSNARQTAEDVVGQMISSVPQELFSPQFFYLPLPLGSTTVGDLDADDDVEGSFSIWNF